MMYRFAVDVGRIYIRAWLTSPLGWALNFPARSSRVPQPPLMGYGMYDINSLYLVDRYDVIGVYQVQPSSILVVYL